MTRCGLEATRVPGSARRQRGCARQQVYASKRLTTAATRGGRADVHGCRRVPYAPEVSLRWRGRAI
jgi:hypothetical protein